MIYFIVHRVKRETELLNFKEIPFCGWTSKQRMKSYLKRKCTRARWKCKKEKYAPAETINNVPHFDRIWRPIPCGIKVVLLATPSGTVRQINGKQIWQVISPHVWKSVDTKRVLDTSHIPQPFLPRIVHSLKISSFAFFCFGLWVASPIWVWT